MNRVGIRSLFQPEVREPVRWRSYATSGVIHFLTAAAILAISVPGIQLVKPAVHRAIEIVPEIPSYHPPISHPKLAVIKAVERRQAPLEVLEVPVRPKLPEPLVPRPIREKEIPAPPKIEIAASNPKPILPELDSKPPGPPVVTNSFATADTAKPVPAAKELKLGFFGDPNGVHSSVQTQERAHLAQVGSFDAGPPAASSVRASSGSRLVSGAFGSVESSGIVSTNNGAHVQTGQFGDSKPSQARSVSSASPSQQIPLTPVEILFKPKPAYTVEARTLKIEGQVALEVVFLSNGEVRIVRVIHGLGHGLDEAAREAAQKVRFRPAMRGGVPVDTNATIYITFELT